MARSVILIGAPAVEGRGHLHAALLRAGPDSFLSHRTAAAAHGLRAIARSHLEVTIPGAARGREGLIVHRTLTQPHLSEIVERSGLRYSSVARLLLELAAQGRGPDEIEHTLLKGVRKGLVDLRELEATIERHHRHPGIAVVRAAAYRYIDPRDRSSELERSFDAYAATDPRIPHYEKNVQMGPYEFDCVFEEERVILELDGRPYHQAVQDMDNDRAKDVYAQLHGLRIIRITDFRWEHDRAGAVQDLLAMLALDQAVRSEAA